MDKPINVLLVDDEPSFIEPIAFWLKTKGYNVDTLGNGREAVERVKKDPPDIVFLDINMPVMDGLEALKIIRGFNKDLPVIILTSAYDDEENIIEAKKLGISGFFAKNHPLDELASTIQVVLRTHKNLSGPSDKP